MLSLEKNYFLQIISDYIYCKPSVCKEKIDWKIIIEFSKFHNLSGVVFNQASEFIADEDKNSFFILSARELASHAKRERLYNSIRDKFNCEKIKFFTVKGLNSAKYYPYPQHRTMGDCDIHVLNKDIKRADNALKEIGFEFHKSPMFENVYRKYGLTFEIHNHLLYDEIANKKCEIAFCDTVWDFVNFDNKSFEGKINESFHFVYLLLHLKKHLIHSGAGFRQFVDIYLTAKNANLDWEFINKNLERLNLTKFASVCGALSYKWFGADNPFPFGFEPAKLDDEFYELATEKIFSNGVFGFNDSSNKANISLQNEILKENFSVCQRMMAKIRIVFPKYNDIRFAKKYSFVDNRPLLLPVAWVYRIFCVIFGKAGKKVNKDSDIPLTNEDIDNRKDMLDNFGLL